MKIFLTLLINFSIIPAIAGSNFETYLGKYEVTSQTCQRNGVIDDLNCGLSEISIEYDEDTLRLFEIKHPGSSLGHAISEYDFSEGRNTYKGQIQDYEDGSVVWTHNQTVYQFADSGPMQIFKRLEITRNNNRELQYIFQYFEDSPLMRRPIDILRYYTIVPKD
ncbi:MAG: hypothetical protein CL677_07640 [Bdellovibrionaceae bacterium]|nr:hypothetical protein [Pseudobdellovibrionaceae bacterium]|tara:strand:- start:114591 stop:115082 length:492 start_codon:yes stop_codon:yes gene_type:complete